MNDALVCRGGWDGTTSQLGLNDDLRNEETAANNNVVGGDDGMTSPETEKVGQLRPPEESETRRDSRLQLPRVLVEEFELFDDGLGLLLSMVCPKPSGIVNHLKSQEEEEEDVAHKERLGCAAPTSRTREPSLRRNMNHKVSEWVRS